MKRSYSIMLAAVLIVVAAMAFKPKPVDVDKFSMAGEKIQLTNEPAAWAFDAKHSNVAFNVNYMAISQVSGRFNAAKGSMESSKADFSDAKIQFTIDAASIDTDDAGRDKHLQSDDFFNAEKYPTITFTSTSFKPLGNNKYELTGDLTVRDVTKPIRFEVKHGGNIKDARGNIRAGFMARGEMNRFDYGIKWDSKTPEGGLVVDENVEIVLNIQMRQAAAKPQS